MVAVVFDYIWEPNNDLHVLREEMTDIEFNLLLENLNKHIVQNITELVAEHVLITEFINKERHIKIEIVLDKKRYRNDHVLLELYLGEL